MPRMSQDYGRPVPPPHHAGTAPRSAARARWLVLIDEAGTSIARLFDADRHEVASLDGGTEEVARMTSGLPAAPQGADDPAWDRALAGHSMDERRAARVWALDL